MENDDALKQTDIVLEEILRQLYALTQPSPHKRGEGVHCMSGCRVDFVSSRVHI